jgi:hypothetical protein
MHTPHAITAAVGADAGKFKTFAGSAGDIIAEGGMRMHWRQMVRQGSHMRIDVAHLVIAIFR